MFPITVVVTATAGELKFESRYLATDTSLTPIQLGIEAHQYAEDCIRRWEKHAPEGFDTFSVRIINRNFKAGNYA